MESEADQPDATADEESDQDGPSTGASHPTLRASRLSRLGRGLAGALGFTAALFAVVAGIRSFEPGSGPRQGSPPGLERELSQPETPVPSEATSQLGFGSATGPRTAIRYAVITPVPATPTLDSMSALLYGEGDERKFLRVRASAPTVSWPARAVARARYATAAAGDDIWVHVLVDNNASPQTSCATPSSRQPAVARNTRLSVAIWNSVNKHDHVIRAWLSADNASPPWITDAVQVSTNHAGTLEFDRYGSSLYSVLPRGYAPPRPLDSASAMQPTGMLVGPGGLLGSCWQNRVYVVLEFRQK
jgi:hypothetical protein